MLNPDEIIDHGFAALRDATPSLTPSDLAALARRRAARARLQKSVAAFAGCAAIGAIAGIAFKPTSALAALREAASRSKTQPIVHLHMEGSRHFVHPTSPPWPPTEALDIWRLPDRYVRKQGHGLVVMYRNGRMLSYDDRFPMGFSQTYDAKRDMFWNFDGTIGIELKLAGRKPPQVRSVVRDGEPMVEYEFQDGNPMGYRSTTDFYVSQTTNLVRSSVGDSVGPNGDSSHSITTVEYPAAEDAARELPLFPKGVAFETKSDLLKEFDREVRRPDQTKTCAGVQISLYGVILSKNVPNGITAMILTQGGPGPNVASGHPPEIVGEKLLPAKKLDWFPGWSLAGYRFTSEQTALRRTYTVYQSNDLLEKVPKRLTLRIPVWGRSATVESNSKDGGVFLGYLTFTTSRIFCIPGDATWTYFGSHRDG